MALNRLIARLDIKQNKLIKGMHLEGWRFLPRTPNEYCFDYYKKGIDEIIYIDVVASLYGRDMLIDIVKATSANVFVPVTAGGGVRSVEDAQALLRAGADKIAVCSGAIKDPALISEISTRFGAQCMVLSVQAKRDDRTGKYEAYYDVGREASGLDVLEWCKQGVALGAGEILLTSIDKEGSRKGFDTALISMVSSEVNVPVIASGGFGKNSDFTEAVNAGANACAVAYNLHYNVSEIRDIKEEARAAGIEMRNEY